ncbi:tetratricopeptide repeat protein [Aeromonas allosaccharophila]|uniref:tetratricopeptide repeat protein n=1 Tax=Aeromonas allosaccharophila TaxID=656 RepID=UPI003004F9F3
MPARPLTLTWLLVSLLGSVQAKAVVEPVEWLLSQIRLGEVTHNEELLGNSLYSLSLIEPQHPELLAARARLALASGKLEEAETLLNQLGKLVPDSSLYRLSMLNLRINEPASRARLQQARQLANEGDLEGALARYHALFGGNEAPNLELAVEYAVLNDQIPARRSEALVMMRALEQRYPGHARLRATLAHRLLSSGPRDEGMALLLKMAASHATRDSAARIWLADIRRMPVGPASLASLQQFIVTFATDSHSDEAQTLLAQQEALWASPAFRQRQATLARAADQRAPLVELQRLHTRYPEDPEVMGALGLAYARQHQREQANRLFERLLRHHDLPQRGRWERQWESNRYWLILERAKQAQASQQWEQASTLYRQVIGLGGNRPEAWLGLGDCELARHQHGAAEQAYLRALNIAPKNERARLRLFALYRDQDPERALALLSPPRGGLRHCNNRELASGPICWSGMLRRWSNPAIGHRH